MKTRFDYSNARAYCEQLGLAFDDQALPMADKCFAAFGLLQEQVDGVMRLHAWVTGWRFNPATYTFRQRLWLAWHFLFGRSNPAFQQPEGE